MAFFMFGRLFGILYLCEAPSQTVGLTIFVENSVVSYPFKGKFYKEKKEI